MGVDLLLQLSSSREEIDVELFSEMKNLNEGKTIDYSINSPKL